MVMKWLKLRSQSKNQKTKILNLNDYPAAGSDKPPRSIPDLTWRSFKNEFTRHIVKIFRNGIAPDSLPST
jgi:hypothetical protein